MKVMQRRRTYLLRIAKFMNHLRSFSRALLLEICPFLRFVRSMNLRSSDSHVLRFLQLHFYDSPGTIVSAVCLSERYFKKHPFSNGTLETPIVERERYFE